jgi:hypothetical protein
MHDSFYLLAAAILSPYPLLSKQADYTNPLPPQGNYEGKNSFSHLSG